MLLKTVHLTIDDAISQGKETVTHASCKAKPIRPLITASKPAQQSVGMVP